MGDDGRPPQEIYQPREPSSYEVYTDKMSRLLNYSCRQLERLGFNFENNKELKEWYSGINPKFNPEAPKDKSMIKEKDDKSVTFSSEVDSLPVKISVEYDYKDEETPTKAVTFYQYPCFGSEELQMAEMGSTLNYLLDEIISYLSYKERKQDHITCEKKGDEVVSEIRDHILELMAVNNLEE